QTKPGPAVFTGRRLIDLPEVLEDLPQILFTDADTGVRYVDEHAVAADRRGGRNGDASLVRELHGIGEEVQDDLLHFRPVCPDDGETGVELDEVIEVLPPDHRLDGLGDLAD